MYLHNLRYYLDLVGGNVPEMPLSINRHLLNSDLCWPNSSILSLSLSLSHNNPNNITVTVDLIIKN